MTCNKCNEDKHYSEFTVDNGKVSGHTSSCRSCTNKIYKRTYGVPPKVKNYKDYLRIEEERKNG